jgi:hypothetical protein
MGLSDLEKKAGRVFLAGCQRELDELNAARPPGGHALPLWRVVRHQCPSRGGASVGIELHEHYEASPELWVCYCGVIQPFVRYVFPHEDCQGGKPAAAEGLLAFVWKDGRCADCGLVVRSARGQLVLAADRPPERERRVARQA